MAGILQGCPLSGLLFTVVSHQFFLHFTAVVDRRGRGASPICADDLGCLLFDLDFLQFLVAPFEAARALANLSAESQERTGACVV